MIHSLSTTSVPGCSGSRIVVPLLPGGSLRSPTRLISFRPAGAEYVTERQQEPNVTPPSNYTRRSRGLPRAMSGAARFRRGWVWVVRKTSLGRQRLVRHSEKMAAGRERLDSGQTGYCAAESAAAASGQAAGVN